MIYYKFLARQLYTGCISVLIDVLSCPVDGRLALSRIGQSPAAPAASATPGSAGSAFSRTGRSPAVFRPSAVDCHAPGLAESAFRTRTVPVWPCRPSSNFWTATCPALLVFTLLIQSDHCRRLPHRCPGKKILGHEHQIVAVTGADNNTNLSFITFLFTTICPAGGRHYSQLGAYSQTFTLDITLYVHLSQHTLYM